MNSKYTQMQVQGTIKQTKVTFNYFSDYQCTYFYE